MAVRRGGMWGTILGPGTMQLAKSRVSCESAIEVLRTNPQYGANLSTTRCGGALQTTMHMRVAYHLLKLPRPGLSKSRCGRAFQNTFQDRNVEWHPPGETHSPHLHINKRRCGVGMQNTYAHENSTLQTLMVTQIIHLSGLVTYYTL